ncbi:DUF3311 domain-containing protein [Demetria terragena]|uniref:DUF3311 domain-containing protein n=1 Tax=Demetria terragena TaxID=63959 RepID=UPI00036F70EA|nr:DUF3311 domain-containing protein [Demetria terragena]
MSQPSRRDTAPPTDSRYLWAAGVFLVIPLIALAAVPTYAKVGPELGGWPFFFWYQTLWVFITAACTTTAFYLVKKARAPRDGGES